MYIRRSVGWVVGLIGYLTNFKEMEIKNRIAELFKEKTKINKEIDDIQKSCLHSQKSLKSIQERVDSTTTVIRHVCDTCHSVLGIPNNDDLEIFLRE